MMEEEGGITQLKAELKQQQEANINQDKELREKTKVLVKCTAYTEIVSAHAKRLAKGMAVLLKPGGFPETYVGQKIKDYYVDEDKITFLNEDGHKCSWPIVFVEPVEEDVQMEDVQMG